MKPGNALIKRFPTNRARNSVAFFVVMFFLWGGCSKENIHPRDLFGYWTCIETGEINDSRGYTVFIDQYGSELDKIIIDNFYDQGFGHKIIAILQNGEFTIEEQTVNGLTYKGTGEVNGLKNKINLDYTAVADTLQDHLKAEYKR